MSDIATEIERMKRKSTELRERQGKPEPCDHSYGRRGFYGTKCAACGQDFLGRTR